MQVKALLSVEYKISKVCDVLLRASVAEDTGCFIAPHVDHGAEYVDVCAGRARWSNVDPAGVCTGVWGYAAVVQGALCAPRYSQQLQSRPSSRTLSIRFWPRVPYRPQYKPQTSVGNIQRTVPL